MALNYILEQVGYKMGLDPSQSTQRSVLLRFVNTAAKELYHMSDMAGCYEEQYFKVNANQTIALPDYVGQIRALRSGVSILVATPGRLIDLIEKKHVELDDVVVTVLLPILYWLPCLSVSICISVLVSILPPSIFAPIFP